MYLYFKIVYINCIVNFYIFIQGCIDQQLNFFFLIIRCLRQMKSSSSIFLFNIFVMLLLSKKKLFYLNKKITSKQAISLTELISSPSRQVGKRVH